MTLHQAGHWELATSHVILLVEEEFTTSSNCHGKQRHGGILKAQFRKKNPAWLIEKPAWPFLSYIPVECIMLIFVLSLHEYDGKIPIILWSTQNNDFQFHFQNFQNSPTLVQTEQGTCRIVAMQFETTQIQVLSNVFTAVTIVAF